MKLAVLFVSLSLLLGTSYSVPGEAVIPGKLYTGVCCDYETFHEIAVCFANDYTLETLMARASSWDKAGNPFQMEVKYSALDNDRKYHFESFEYFDLPDDGKMSFTPKELLWWIALTKRFESWIVKSSDFEFWISDSQGSSKFIGELNKPNTDWQSIAQSLVQHLATAIHECPYKSWGHFVSCLRNCDIDSRDIQLLQDYVNANPLIKAPRIPRWKVDWLCQGLCDSQPDVSTFSRHGRC